MTFFESLNLPSLQFDDLELLYYGLAVIAILVVVLTVFRQKKEITFFSILLRCLALTCLLIALAGPYLEKEHRSSRALALLDISDSNEISQSDSLLEKVQSFKEQGLELDLVAFASKASTSTRFTSDVDTFREVQSAWPKLDIGATNFEEAFRRIQTLDASSIVLISDGYETNGNSAAVLQDISSQGFRIYPLVPDNAEVQKQSFRISNLYVPLVAASEKSVDIKVSIANSSSAMEQAVLEVKHDGKIVLTKEVQVASGKEIVVTAKSDPSKEGIKEITASLKPSNTNYSSSSATAYLSGEALEKVLLVNGNGEDARFLRRVLEGQAFQVKELTGAQEAAQLGDIASYSVVIFNNIPLKDLPNGTATRIENYVNSGGSFVMIGGNRSFGLGGYLNSSIEDVLPVILVPPQTVEKRLNVAVQLVMDKSGSMAEGNRIEFAKEAAIETVNNLKDEDYIGVMGFDKNPFVVIRLKRVSEAKLEAVRRIGLLNPKGGTSLVGSMDEARRDLIRVNAGRKHMIILSDGEITDAPKHYYYDLVKQVRLLGITVSTVSLGSDAEQAMLREMANLGGGAFYQTSDARSLPKIFIADLKVAAGERTMKEQSEYDVRPGPADLKTTSISSFPSLRGYVQTKPKARANTELVVSSDNKSDPLLASWNYGKGKSLAFTSDANGRWSERWVDWLRFHEFWSDVVESMRQETGAEEERVKFDLRSYVERGVLLFDLTVFSENISGPVEAEITLPNTEKRRIVFNATAPGHYLAQMSSPIAGKYEFRGQVGRSKLTPVAFQVSGDLFGEKKGQGFNLPFLRNLSSVTSGKINPSIEDLKSQSYLTKTKNDLTFYFLMAALIILLFEILWREVFSSSFRNLFFSKYQNPLLK